MSFDDTTRYEHRFFFLAFFSLIHSVVFLTAVLSYSITSIPVARMTKQATEQRHSNNTFSTSHFATLCDETSPKIAAVSPSASKKLVLDDDKPLLWTRIYDATARLRNEGRTVLSIDLLPMERATRDRLYIFYEMMNPQNARNVEHILREFAGRENELWEQLSQKYGAKAVQDAVGN